MGIPERSHRNIAEKRSEGKAPTRNRRQMPHSCSRPPGSYFVNLYRVGTHGVVQRLSDAFNLISERGREPQLYYVVYNIYRYTTIHSLSLARSRPSKINESRANPRCTRHAVGSQLLGRVHLLIACLLVIALPAILYNLQTNVHILVPADMDQIGEPNQRERLEGFDFLFYLTEAVGVLLIVLVGIWVFHFRGGLAWTSNPGVEFNWHPLLMTIGLVFLYANGMLIYRSQRTLRKRRLKLIHAGIMIFIVFLTIIAQIAVFDSHNLALSGPIPNLYSLHSWVGLTSILLFCCQWVAGLVSFLYPIIQPPLRAAYLPIHVYFGTAAFIGTIASCLMGLTEKALFTLNDPSAPIKYSQLPSEGVLINLIGLLFVIFGGLTVYLVSQDRYKRLARPEDDVLLTGRSE